MAGSCIENGQLQFPTQTPPPAQQPQVLQFHGLPVSSVYVVKF